MRPAMFFRVTGPAPAGAGVTRHDPQMNITISTPESLLY